MVDTLENLKTEDILQNLKMQGWHEVTKPESTVAQPRSAKGNPSVL